MKITIEYDNIVDAKLAMDAFSWKCIVEDLDQWLRAKIKHEDQHEFQPVRDMLNSLVSDEDLSLYG
jgi:hypothetical protein